MAKVALENVVKRYENVTAIADINLKIADGQFCVLVGPSGCGKSTIMRTIAGLETATSGNIYIGDQIVNDLPAKQRDVAMVFQNYALYPHFTVAENLAFGLKMRGVGKEKIRERVQQVAQSLAIEHLLNRKPKQLSGGQQQRVALGRAIAREPQVFLLDEPLSNLDAQLRDDTRAELKQLHQRLGITTIYVTHDQVEAMTLADQIVVLSGGNIQQVGEPQKIYARPANKMVATFLGNPPMNILPVTYDNSLFWLGEQSLSCPPVVREKLQPQAGQIFDLGIRPEHIQINNLENLSKEPDVLDGDLWALETAPLEVLVNVVEPLGREILVRANVWDKGQVLQTTPIQFMAEPGIRLKPQERLSIKLDFNHIFIFDAHTGYVLYP